MLFVSRLSSLFLSDVFPAVWIMLFLSRKCHACRKSGVCAVPSEQCFIMCQPVGEFLYHTVLLVDLLLVFKPHRSHVISVFLLKLHHFIFKTVYPFVFAAGLFLVILPYLITLISPDIPDFYSLYAGLG